MKHVVFDLLQLLELFFLLLDLLLLLRDLGLTLLLLHAQFLDDVGVLQLRLGQLFTLKRTQSVKHTVRRRLTQMMGQYTSCRQSTGVT